MVFSSAVFLCMFLPITLLGYYLLRGKARNYWLLFVSLLFYAYGEEKYICIMIASILINYVGGICVDKLRYRRICLGLTIFLNLSLLTYFKYADFIIESINAITKKELDLLGVVLPIGISFFTFQGISYVIDVYRQDVSVQKNPFKLGLYISMFPQLIAGPIVRYSTIEREIDHRKETIEDFAYGIRRFTIGLAKKAILANNFAVFVDKIWQIEYKNLAVSVAWLGAIGYMLQIFYDFAGYSDMAIGLGRMFGFHFEENFNYPYISKSIREFWRRWHISLSSWFRDYLYIPLGGNRKGTFRTYINLCIVFIVTGLWHGAAWQFVIWGLWHGFFNIVERLLANNSKEKKQIKHLDWLCVLYTNFVVLIGWVFFRADSITDAIAYLKGMFGLNTVKFISFEAIYYLDRYTVFCLVLGVVFATPLCKMGVEQVTRKWNPVVKDAIGNAIILALLFFCMMTVLTSTYNPFIYFRF